MNLTDERLRFVSIDDPGENRTIGQKALSLVFLNRNGFNVPRCFFIPAGWFQETLEAADVRQPDEQTGNIPLFLADQRKKILSYSFPEHFRSGLQAFLDPGKAYAVRSSGLKEDLAAASFAGQYTTVLDARGIHAVLAAVKRCFASVFEEGVHAYCREKSIPFDSLSMSVIVQEMVDAEVSGVLFSVDPLRGNDTEILIEACRGLGDKLVGGHLTPQIYRYDWYRDLMIETPAADAVLPDYEIRTLAAAAVRIQAACGFPADIEWVYKDSEFLFLQVRPITTLHTNGIEGQWTTADFKDGGVSSSVCSPMMWSLYDFIWENAMPGYLSSVCLDLHLKRQKKTVYDFIWGRMFYGRPYWNAGEAKNSVAAIPGFHERDFDEDLGITVAYEGPGRTTGFTVSSIRAGLKIRAALKASFQNCLERAPEFVKNQKERIAALDSLNLDGMSDRELFDRFEELIKVEYRNTETAYFLHIFDNSNCQTMFKSTMKKFQRINYLHLMVGLENLSHLIPNYELWDLSRRIRGDREAFSYYTGQSVDGILHDYRSGQAHAMLLAEFIRKFSYHSVRELDITVPDYDEDPYFVFEQVKKLIELSDEHNPRDTVRNQIRIYELERKKLLAAAGLFRRERIAAEVDRVRSFLWWREELRDVSTRMYHQIRRFLIALQRRLLLSGRLEKPDDIFFLPVMTLIGYLNGTVDRACCAETIRKNRLYYDSFRNFANPPDIGFSIREQSGKNPDDVFARGIAASPGIRTGTARVISSIRDAGRIREGDILVTKFTDPGWTFVFGLIGGVVTETGGVLSHAAVISREYGIPAILAVSNGTQLIKDGEIITIDGSHGLIYRGEIRW